METTERNNRHFLKCKFKGRKLLIGFFLAIVVICFIVIAGYFDAKTPESYLPKVKTRYFRPHSSDGMKMKLENRWYVLEVDDYGGIVIKTVNGEILMAGLKYYSVYENNIENWGLDSVALKLCNDSTVSVSGKGASGVLVSISLTVSMDKPEMEVNVKTQYNQATIVRREALVVKFNEPLSEVYRKNGIIDVDSFDSEYWLQRQGARFGNGSKSSLIYHTPHISSLQLNSKKNLLFFNLEYFLDHPFINIPYQKDGAGRWVDFSAANYSMGNVRNDSFTIYFGTLHKVTPRLMPVPHGYLAGYVFTEHADGGNIRTQRAAYFGSESITNIQEATGGFAGNKIPVTKSVFYADTTSGHSVNSIRDDPDKPQFLDFLDQLYVTGLYDICLHTPDTYSSDRKTLSEAIEFMKHRYNAKTWIDHGMESGDMNRESYVCDGLNPNAELFAADLWEKYDTRYFWSRAGEAMGRNSPSLKEGIKKLRLRKVSAELWARYWFQKEYMGDRTFKSLAIILKGYIPRYELNSIQPLRGSSYPTPLYWQNITMTSNFYSWITNFVYNGISSDKAEDQLNDEINQLNRLIKDRGIFLNHGYFVRNRIDDCILSVNNGLLVINPYFEKVLVQMAQMRDNGDLYITTIRDLLDYWVLTDKISFEYQPDGEIIIYNDNEMPIKGLSLAMHTIASSVRINGEITAFKQVGEDAIVWFDISGKSHVNLEVY